MKITIQKYLKPTDPDKSSNLFSGNCVFVDQIVFERHLKNAFPTFNSEYYYQDDILFIKAGDFDLQVGILLTERSDFEDKNIYDFFNQVDPSEEGREKYFILCEITPLNKPSGIIQIDTIEASEKQTLLSFSVIGIDKEITDWMDSITLKSMLEWGHDYDMPWESQYLPLHHFREINSSGFSFLNVISQLNIDDKVTHSVFMEWEMQNNLFVGGLNRGYSVWAGLKSFMIQWGFRFIVQFYRFQENKPTFIIYLKWHSDYINDVGDITRYIDYRKSLVVSDVRWIFLQSGQLVESIDNVDYYVGMLFDKDHTYIGDAAWSPPTRIGYNAQRNVFQGLPGVPEVPAEKVKVIKADFHAQSWLWWEQYNINVVYAQCAYALSPQNQQHYYSTILLQCPWAEYRHLFTGTTGRRKLVLNISEIDVVVGSKGTIDGKPFICVRITSYDDFNKQCESEWQQII